MLIEFEYEMFRWFILVCLPVFVKNSKFCKLASAIHLEIKKQSLPFQLAIYTFRSLVKWIFDINARYVFQTSKATGPEIFIKYLINISIFHVAGHLSHLVQVFLLGYLEWLQVPCFTNGGSK